MILFLLLLYLLIIILGTQWAMKKGKFLHWVIGVTAGAITLFLYIIGTDLGLRHLDGLLGLLTLMFVLHTVVVVKGYEKIRSFDKQLHFLGGMIGGLIIYSFLYYSPPSPIPIQLFFFTVILMFGITIIWEFCQFMADKYWDYKARLGRDDTMTDIVYTVAGCFFSSLFLLAFNYVP